ncbi:MAG: hypothetical protein HYX41_04315 [Bdellovibrio sp.]|nr:hypothetical protein [Bdellovibrio sp.]
MEKKRIHLSYPGSKGWLIFWLIVLFPVALVLLFTLAEFEMDGKTYRIQYNGSRGWLAFWWVCLFPVGVLLFFLNGFELITGTTAQSS